MEGAEPGRPRIVAVDGRGGSGKTTLAERLRAAVPGAHVVHTDDVAWHAPRASAGSSRWRRACWSRSGAASRSRTGRRAGSRTAGPGQIEIGAGTPLVVVEGVGAARRALARTSSTRASGSSPTSSRPSAGAWCATAATRRSRQWHEWMAEELPFLAADRPWERVTAIVAGTEALAHDLAAEVRARPAGPRAAPSTLAVSAGRPPAVPGGPLNPPVVFTSTYHAGGRAHLRPLGRADAERLRGRARARCEGGRCVTFSSGLAAVAAVLRDAARRRAGRRSRAASTGACTRCSTTAWRPGGSPRRPSTSRTRRRRWPRARAPRCCGWRRRRTR